MSRKDTGQDRRGPQCSADSRSTPLTAANLAAYNETTSAIPPGIQHHENDNMQRWLTRADDCQPPTREAREVRNWDRLVENDDVAAAIESATRREGAAARKHDD